MMSSLPRPVQAELRSSCVQSARSGMRCRGRRAQHACARTDSQQSQGLQPTSSPRPQHGCPPPVTSFSCGCPRSCCLR